MKNKYAKGFSAIELLIVLVIIGIFVKVTISMSDEVLSQTPTQVTSTEVFSYSQEVGRYINTYYNILLRITRNNTGNTNNQIVTITPKVLLAEGIITQAEYNKYRKNKLNQYPCTVINFSQNKLNVYTYYRSDQQLANQFSQKQLMQGLRHGGGFMGLYHDGIVEGNNWSMNHDYIESMFIKKGITNSEITLKAPASDFICEGSNIANNSYVVDVRNQLKNLPHVLPEDDNLHRHGDDLNPSYMESSHNLLSTDLIMESNPIIFQMNPDCVMDPENPATLEDYDPDRNKEYQNNPAESNYYIGPNRLGCRNRQLALQAQVDKNGQTHLIVRGFTRIESSSLTESPTYMGGVKAEFFQPTYPIKPLTRCKANEVGTMARQAITGNKYFDYEIGNVICQKSPTCLRNKAGVAEPNISPYCYLPSHGLRVNIWNRGNPSGPVSCPDGLFVIFTKYQPAIQPEPCSANDIFGFRHKCNIIRCGEGNQSGECSKPVQLASSDIYAATDIYPDWELKKSVYMSEVNWWQSCDGNLLHLGCYEGYRVGKTSGTIEYITCSSEPSDLKPEVNEDFFIKQFRNNI